MCDEIIDAEKKDTVLTNFNEKKYHEKQKSSAFLLHFYYHHYIIDSCLYLLLSDKMSSKTQTFITILSHK